MFRYLHKKWQDISPFQWREPELSAQEQVLEDIKFHQKTRIETIQKDATTIFMLAASGFYTEAYVLLDPLRISIFDCIAESTQQDITNTAMPITERLLSLNAELLGSTVAFFRLLDAFLSRETPPSTTEIETLLGTLRVCLKDLVHFQKDLELTSMRTSLDHYKVQQIRRRNYFLGLIFLLSFVCFFSGYLSYKSVGIILSEVRTYLNDRKLSDIHINLIDGTLPAGIKTTNLGPVETDKSGLCFSWALGPEMRVTFVMPLGGNIKFSFRINNPIPGQSLKIIANNGEQVKVLDHLEPQPWLKNTTQDSLTFHARPGVNSIRILFADWNTHKTHFAPHDSRPLAVAVMDMQLDKVETR